MKSYAIPAAEDELWKPREAQVKNLVNEVLVDAISRRVSYIALSVHDGATQISYNRRFSNKWKRVMVPPQNWFSYLHRHILSLFKRENDEDRPYFTISFGGDWFGQIYLEHVDDFSLILKVKTYPTRKKLTLADRWGVLLDMLVDHHIPKASP